MVEVVFEDNHVLVLNKPAGILTQPDYTGRPSLEAEAKKLLNRTFLHAVHRLDRPVSGLVLFAKSSKALSRLNDAMRKGLIKKIYHAKVESPPKNPKGTLIHFILRDEKKMLIVSPDTPGAKRAELFYNSIEPTLLEIHLITGRKHQIRIQLASIGCPICGDAKYGSKTESETIALTATELSFPHPITKEIISVSIPK